MTIAGDAALARAQDSRALPRGVRMCMTCPEFRGALRMAAPGAEIVYFEAAGCLAEYRHTVRVRALADEVWQAYRARQVLLLTRTVADGVQYLVQKASASHAAESSVIDEIAAEGRLDALDDNERHKTKNRKLRESRRKARAGHA